MLNPIEEVFADFKRAIRTELSTRLAAEILAIDSGSWGEKGRRRGEVLEKAYATALGSLTPALINNHIVHTNSAIGKAIQMEDL